MSELVPEAVVGLVIYKERMLIQQRPLTSSFPGWWEMPGGKVEPGESLKQALCRELFEEVGLDCYPAGAIKFFEVLGDFGQLDVAEKWIRVHFYWVHDYRGEPFGKEGQTIGYSDLTTQVISGPEGGRIFPPNICAMEMFKHWRDGKFTEPPPRHKRGMSREAMEEIKKLDPNATFDEDGQAFKTGLDYGAIQDILECHD